VHEVYVNFSHEMCCVVVCFSSQISNSAPFMPLFVLSVKFVRFYGLVVPYSLSFVRLCASKSGKIKPGALQLCWPVQPVPTA